MTEKTTFKVEADSKEAVIREVTQFLDAFEVSYPVECSIMPATKEADYRAVFWIWMRFITKEFQEKWPSAYGMLDKSGNLLHDVICQMFLGQTKAQRVGNKVLEPRQKTWTDLKTNGERYNLLRGVEEWCLEIGIALPQPPSEYLRDKKKQSA